MILCTASLPVVTAMDTDEIITDLKNKDSLTNSETTTPYVINAIGESGNVTMNAESIQVHGNISSTNDINIKSNHFMCLGNRTENDNGYIFDSISKLYNGLKYTDVNPQTINTYYCDINTECYYPEYNCYADLISLSSKIFSNASINLMQRK